jgi:hypothetical protein
MKASDGFNPLQSPCIWVRARITEQGLKMQIMDQPRNSEEGKATGKEGEGTRRKQFVGQIMRQKII